MKYLIQLDGLRGIAVLLVLQFHWLGGDFGFFQLETGTLGVYLFFVLSGFLISSILLSQKEEKLSKNIKRFYIRRVLRIFPIYYLFIAILFMVDYPGVREHFQYFLLYIQNFLFHFEPIDGHITHLWSLAVEEQFYMLWPFLVLLLPIKSIRTVSILILILTPISLLLYNAMYGSYSFGLTFFSFEGFAWGYLAADAFSRGIKLKGTQLLILSSALMILFTALDSHANLDLAFIQRSIYSFFGYSVVVVLVQNEFSGLTKFFSMRSLVWLGKLSYGIYLYHRVVPKLYEHFHLICAENSINIPFTDTILLPYLPSQYMSVVYLPITLVIAVVSYQLIEKPFLKLKTRFA